MTEPFDEYGERLRRVLHAEAETVTPSPEGLEQIRGKIAERRERRFGPWFAIPWARPLVAVAAAVIIVAVAVSATPALKTFVQTGHFSPEDHHSGTAAVVGGQQPSAVQSLPGVSSHPGAPVSPHPSTSPSSTSGGHVVTGSTCPAGEDPVAPPPSAASGAKTATAAPSQGVTCRPGTVTPASPTDKVPPPVTTSPVQPPTSEPPSNGGQQQPSVQAQSSP